MKKDKFLLIRISPAYVSFLRNYDSKVMINSKETNKNNRPFLGIIFNINNLDYFIPLSSYKKSKTRITKIYKNYINSGYKPLDIFFIEDKNKDNSLLAFMNLNNMIPVPEKDKIYFDIQKDKDSSLLIKELDICNDNHSEIIQNCKRIYNAVILKQKNKLVERCCNFPLLEEKCKEWSEIQNNKLILEDYYNGNIKNTRFLDIADIISKSKSLYEAKEYINIIKDSNPKFNYDFNKLDYTKELKELNNDVGDIIGDIEIDNYIELLYNKYNQTLSKERIYNIYDFTNNKDVFDDVVDNIYKKVKDKELKLTDKNIKDTVDAVEKDIRISKSFKGLNNIESKETVEKIYSFTSNKSLFEDIVNKIDSNTNYKPDKMDNEHLYHYVGEVENDLIR